MFCFQINDIDNIRENNSSRNRTMAHQLILHEPIPIYICISLMSVFSLKMYKYQI